MAHPAGCTVEFSHDPEDCRGEDVPVTLTLSPAEASDVSAALLDYAVFCGKVEADPGRYGEGLVRMAEEAHERATAVRMRILDVSREYGGRGAVRSRSRA